MNIESEILGIKNSLRRIESRTRPKNTWINATWLTGLTGWNGEKLRQAREQGIVKFREKSTGSYEYLLESVPEQFIMKKQAV